MNRRRLYSWVSGALFAASACSGSVEQRRQGDTLSAGGTATNVGGAAGAGARPGVGGATGFGGSGFSGDGGLAGTGSGGDGGLAGSGPAGSGGVGGALVIDAGPFDAGGAVVCGDVTCPPLPGNPVASAACCVATDGGAEAGISGSCGYMTSNIPFQPFSSLCHAIDQPGTPDASCPDSVLYFDPSFPELARFKGCCRPDARCGANFGRGFGCVALEDVNGSSQGCTPQ